MQLPPMIQTSAESPVSMPPVSMPLVLRGRRTRRNRLATVLIASAFLLALVPLATLLWEVVSHGASRIDMQFLTYSMRNVVGPGGGIYHALVGTLLVTGMAATLSVPVGVLTAVYLVEYGEGRLSRVLSLLVDVMTGIPSIVAGLFAYAAFAVVFGPGVRMGFGGAVALSVLMLPMVVRSSQAMLDLVPDDLREASYALGVPKWRTVTKVVLPTAFSGIVTGATLAVARVVGETAPLLIICGVADSTNTNLFSGRMTTLPVFIFTEYKTPGVPPQFGIDRAWGAALVLTVLVLALNLLARVVSRRFQSPTRSR